MSVDVLRAINEAVECLLLDRRDVAANDLSSAYSATYELIAAASQGTMTGDGRMYFESGAIVNRFRIALANTQSRLDNGYPTLVKSVSVPEWTSGMQVLMRHGPESKVVKDRPLNWVEAEQARRFGIKLQVRDVMHGCKWIDSDGGEITEHCSDLEWRVHPEIDSSQTVSTNEQIPSIPACDMGVGCDEAGVCFAMAQGQPDRCRRLSVEGPDPAAD